MYLSLVMWLPSECCRCNCNICESANSAFAACVSVSAWPAPENNLAISRSAPLAAWTYQQYDQRSPPFSPLISTPSPQGKELILPTQQLSATLHILSPTSVTENCHHSNITFGLLQYVRTLPKSGKFVWKAEKSPSSQKRLRRSSPNFLPLSFQPWGNRALGGWLCTWVPGFCYHNEY